MPQSSPSKTSNNYKEDGSLNFVKTPRDATTKPPSSSAIVDCTDSNSSSTSLKEARDQFFQVVQDLMEGLQSPAFGFGRERATRAVWSYLLLVSPSPSDDNDNTSSGAIVKTAEAMLRHPMGTSYGRAVAIAKTMQMKMIRLKGISTETNPSSSMLLTQAVMELVDKLQSVNVEHLASCSDFCGDIGTTAATTPTTKSGARASRSSARDSGHAGKNCAKHNASRATSSTMVASLPPLPSCLDKAGTVSLQKSISSSKKGSGKANSSKTRSTNDHKSLALMNAVTRKRSVDDASATVDASANATSVSSLEGSLAAAEKKIRSSAPESATATTRSVAVATADRKPSATIATGGRKRSRAAAALLENQQESSTKTNSASISVGSPQKRSRP